jgi:hypothetical protein
MAKRAGKRRKRRVTAAEVRSTLGAGAELVRLAANVLDSELAVGIEAAKAVQKRVDRERRIDARDFNDALQRFRADAHEVVNSLDAQISGAKLQQNLDLAKKIISQANDAVDLAVGVVTTSASVANEFIRNNVTATDARPTSKRRPKS